MRCKQSPGRRHVTPVYPGYNKGMQKKIFWTAFTALGLVADVALPFWWAIAATLPIGVASWWVAYRSDWF